MLRPLRPGEPSIQEQIRKSAERHARRILNRHQEDPAMSSTATATRRTTNPNPNAATALVVLTGTYVALRYQDANGRELESHPLPGSEEYALINATARLERDGYQLLYPRHPWHGGVDQNGHIAYAARITLA